MKKGPETELLDRYLDRARKAGAQLGITGPQMVFRTESRAATPALRKRDESQQLLGITAPGSLLVALDETGRDMTTRQLSERIRTAMDGSVPEIAMTIGGPDGHGDELLQRADLVLRMGRLTWPHQLARVMLAEQVYRAISILAGHPYHRD